MGYYILKSGTVWKDFCLVAINSPDGYCVFKPKKYEALFADLKSTLEYKNLCNELFQYGRELETLTSYYSNYALTLKEAKSSSPKEFLMEELEYNFILKNRAPDDLNFRLSETVSVNSMPSVAKLVFEFFIAGSKFLGMEVVGDSFRFFIKPSKIGSFFSSRRTGDTAFSISSHDIKDIEVTVDCLGVKKKAGPSLELGRDSYKYSDGLRQYRNGTSAM